MKKTRIKNLLSSIMHGAKNADELIMSQVNDTSKIITHEQHQEQDSVWADLLKGIVTERVKEMRYEMYHAERKSHEYDQPYNSRDNRKNNIFNIVDNVLLYNDCDPVIVLPNVVIKGSSDENDMSHYLDEYTINIERDFIPKFKLEQQVTKLVLFRLNENEYIADFYVPQYEKQFDRLDKIFHNEIKKIENGDIKNDLIAFDNFDFTTMHAFGADDYIEYSFKQVSFIELLKYDGSYILRFKANDSTINDLLDEIYHEETARKIAENAPRENNVIDFENAVYQINKDRKAKEIQETLSELNED